MSDLIADMQNKVSELIAEAKEPLVARIAELEAKVEHDEDNREGLEHALVRANQQYTQAKADLAGCDEWAKSEARMKELAEVKLAALMARRCDNCKWGGGCSIQRAGQCAGFSCNRWAKRDV